MELIFKAMISQYQSQKDTAIAELSVLCQSPVGIAAHSNIVQECKAKIKAIAEAEGELQVLTKIINENSPPESKRTSDVN